MSWIYMAWRNLGLKKLQTLLSLILLAFGVGLVSLLMLTEKQLSDTFDRNIQDIDLVLGAKGSPLQLILANVYHVDAPTGKITEDFASLGAMIPTWHITTPFSRQGAPSQRPLKWWSANE
jgi:putative ABC transport system permease protein